MRQQINLLFENKNKSQRELVLLILFLVLIVLNVAIIYKNYSIKLNIHKLRDYQALYERQPHPMRQKTFLPTIKEDNRAQIIYALTQKIDAAVCFIKIKHIKKVIVFEGEARSFSDVLSFINHCSKSTLFTQVTLVNIKPGPNHIVFFKIIVTEH